MKEVEDEFSVSSMWNVAGSCGPRLGPPRPPSAAAGVVRLNHRLLLTVCFGSF